MDDLNLLVWNEIINEDIQEAEEELAIGRDVLSQRNAFALSDRKFVQLFRVDKSLCETIIDMVTPFLIHPTRSSALSIQTKVCKQKTSLFYFVVMKKLNSTLHFRYLLA